MSSIGSPCTTHARNLASHGYLSTVHSTQFWNPFFVHTHLDSGRKADFSVDSCLALNFKQASATLFLSEMGAWSELHVGQLHRLLEQSSAPSILNPFFPRTPQDIRRKSSLASIIPGLDLYPRWLSDMATSSYGLASPSTSFRSHTSDSITFAVLGIMPQDWRPRNRYRPDIHRYTYHQNTTCFRLDTMTWLSAFLFRSWTHCFRYSLLR